MGGASGGHGDGSRVSVTAEELPLDSQKMTMASLKNMLRLKNYSFPTKFCRIFTFSLESAPKEK